jgi:hypothetical protein
LTLRTYVPVRLPAIVKLAISDQFLHGRSSDRYHEIE